MSNRPPWFAPPVGVVTYGIGPTVAPYLPPTVEPIPTVDLDAILARVFDPLMLLTCRGLTPGQLAAGWYAVHALAATLALVPRERVCWVVRWGSGYLAHPAYTPEGYAHCWTSYRCEAERFSTRAEAAAKARRVTGIVVRLVRRRSS